MSAAVYEMSAAGIGAGDDLTVAETPLGRVGGGAAVRQ